MATEMTSPESDSESEPSSCHGTLSQGEGGE